MSRQEQVAGVDAELADTRRRAHQIAAAAEGERWNARPATDQWSAADSLVHVDLTSRAFLPLIDDALRRGQMRAPASARRYRMDLMGRLLWIAATMSLPVKTTERFVPVPEQPKEAVLTEFDALQARRLGFVETAAQVDLGTLLIVSPFDPRLRYNLYSCLRLIAAHQRQHLRPAERVLAATAARRD